MMLKFLLVAAFVGIVAGDGAGHHHGHHGDHGAHHDAAAGGHHAPHHAPAAAAPHHVAHVAPVHHPVHATHAVQPLSFFGRFMQRIRSFVHFGSRRVSTALSLPEGDNRVSFIVGLGVLALVLLVIDLAISGGLQLSVSGRSLDSARPYVEDFATQFYNSVDGVELAMDMMQIEERECRFRAICKAEQKVASHPLARLAIGSINSSIEGLDKYAEAIAAGLNGEDCDLKYDQCSQFMAYF